MSHDRYNLSELSRYFYVDASSESGLRWRVDRWRGFSKTPYVVSGDPVGFLDMSQGYWKVEVNGTRYQVHRVVYLLHHGSLGADLEVDHIDGDRSNNNVENLRAVAPEINSRNAKKRKDNKSGVKGVSKCVRRGKHYWQAWCEKEGRQISKSFLAEKHGDAVAFSLACEWRASMIEELNKQGAGYTARHTEKGTVQ